MPAAHSRMLWHCKLVSLRPMGEKEVGKTVREGDAADEETKSKRKTERGVKRGMEERGSAVELFSVTTEGAVGLRCSIHGSALSFFSLFSSFLSHSPNSLYFSFSLSLPLSLSQRASQRDGGVVRLCRDAGFNLQAPHTHTHKSI